MADQTGIILSGLDQYRQKLESMRVRATTGMRAYLNTTVYTQIQNIQMQRWVSEGASEGDVWRPLNPRYAEYKKKRFAEFPGSGKKMLIATGQLVSNVIGPMSSGDIIGLKGPYRAHRKIVSEKEIFVGIASSDMEEIENSKNKKRKKGSFSPYAKDVNEVRNFSRLSSTSKNWLLSGIKSFVLRGQK